MLVSRLVLPRPNEIGEGLSEFVLFTQHSGQHQHAVSQLLTLPSCFLRVLHTDMSVHTKQFYH